MFRNGVSVTMSDCRISLGMTGRAQCNQVDKSVRPQPIPAKVTEGGSVMGMEWPSRFRSVTDLAPESITLPTFQRLALPIRSLVLEMAPAPEVIASAFLGLAPAFAGTEVPVTVSNAEWSSRKGLIAIITEYVHRCSLVAIPTTARTKRLFLMIGGGHKDLAANWTHLLTGKAIHPYLVTLTRAKVIVLALDFVRQPFKLLAAIRASQNHAFPHGSISAGLTTIAGSLAVGFEFLATARTHFVYHA